MQPKEEMERPAWEVDVDVYVYGEDCDPPFVIDSYLQAKEGGKLVFHNRGRHGFFVRFQLHDETGEGWKFPRQAEHALRSSYGPGCPPASAGQWPQFTAHHSEANGTRLVVRNLNETVAEFGYTLRITKDGGETFRDLDPGGDNQNGNWN
jgi:hypothetical protein